MNGRIKIKFLFIVTFFMVGDLAAQFSTEILIPYRDGKKWGYMNTSGDLVIKTKYQEAYPFENDRGRVMKNGEYGFIDKSGEVKIDFKFNKASDFSGRIAVVRENGVRLYIDTSGVPKYVPAGCGTRLGGRTDYRVFEENGFKGIIRTYPYDTVIEAKYKDAKVFDIVKVFPVMNENDKWGIISGTDSILQAFIYDAIVVIDPSWDIWFMTYIDRRVGAINIYGELEAEAKYYTVKKYKYCYYAVLENGQKGFVYQGKEYWKH